MSYSKNNTPLNSPSHCSRKTVLATFLILAALIGWPLRQSYAQDLGNEDLESRHVYSFSFSGLPLSQALDVLIDATHIDIFYESDLVAGKTSYCAIEQRPAEDVLRCILQRTELDFYRLSSGMYILIDRPRAETRFGALAGLVIDAHTGEPLPDASVMLAYAETGTATNTDGRFALSRLAPGLHPVVITHVAYEDLHDSLHVAPGEQTSVRYDMLPRTFISSPIVVDGLQERMPSEQLQTRRVTAEELILTPGHTPSTHKTLNTIAGVQAGDAFADIHIQGGDSGEHMYTLDGVPVFVPIRNGGFFGAFSPFALSQITVHKAGFTASEGSYLAGVVDIEHELATDSETLLDVQVDALSANGRLQGNLTPWNQARLSWMVAGRIGLWDVLQPAPIERQLSAWSNPNTYIYDTLVPGAENTISATNSPSPFNIQFSDIHAATRLRLGATRSLYLSLYRGHNAFGVQDVPAGSEAAEPEHADYRWSNAMRQARYEWVWGHRTFMHVGAWFSEYTLTHPSDRFPFSLVGEEENEPGEQESVEEVEDFDEISELGVRIGFDAALGARHTLSGSLEPIFTESKFSLSVDPTGATAPIGHQDIRPARSRIQSFIQDEIALSDRTQFKIGSRFTYVPVQQRLYAEPRLSIRHDMPSGPGGAWAVYGATGLYRQFIFQFDVADYNQTTVLPGFRFWIPLGNDDRASSAYHTAAGLLFMPTPQWHLRVEGYYKYQNQLAVLDYINKNGLQKADGYAYGGGVSATYQTPQLRVQADYEYGMARRRVEDRFQGRFVRVPWSTPHQLRASLDLRIVGGLRTMLRWEGIYNRAWAYRHAYYDYLEPLASETSGIQSVFSSPTQHILRVFSQMDGGITYSMSVGKVRVQAGITIINIWDRQNVFDWLLETDGTSLTRQDRFTTPRYASASLRIQY